MIPKNPLKFIVHTTKPHAIWATVALLAVVIAQLAELLEIYIIAQLIDNFAAAETKEEQLQILTYWGTLFLVLLVISKSFWRISGFTGIKWVVEANATAYKKLYAYIINHSHTYFTNRFAGALSNKVSNAADGSLRIVERFVWGWWAEMVSLIATIFLFRQVHWTIAVMTLVTITGLIVFNIWYVKRRRPHVIAYSAASSKLRGEGVDLLTNIAAARQYARKGVELKRLNGTILDRARKDLKQWFMGEWLMVTNSFIAFVMMALVLGSIFVLLQRDLATAGNLVLVLFLLARLSHTFNFMGNMMNGFIRMYGEAEEGLDEILQPYEIEDDQKAVVMKVHRAEIVWNQVDFQFDQNAVFSDFSLTIHAGQRVGLVGSSGAGKTTFVSLLLRQHDIQSGSIEIDGQNIAAVTQDSLRRNIAVVPQEPLLFHRSIRENIAYGKPKATKKEIEAVAKKAQAHDFITELPEGYDTLVGERGVKLSGGQKQRVAIARAMLKDAPILVLDEATSALDSESEVAIQKALHRLMAGKTVIAVAHRLSTLREMDRIIVLDKGRVVEDGTHDALVNYGGVYARLWKHQAGGFLQD